MKKLWKLPGVLLALLAGSPWAARAQVPAPPPAVVPAPAAVVAPAAPVAAVPPRNLWSFLCPTEEQKTRCKARFCGSQFGQLINNSLAPASVFTGGVIPQCCPGPVGDPANLLRPPTSALGAAGRVQADTAAAAARREAVRYLSTVDCNYWPEARAALIASLRADRNECVRLEAALALQRGCCCNKDTIKALVLTVSGGRDDDNPAEDSPRVRAAAMAALEHCLACYVSIAPAPPPPPVPLPTPRKENAPETPFPVPVVPPPVPPPPPVAEPQIRAASYYERVQNLRIEQVVQEARQVLQRAKASQAAAATAAAAATGLHERSLGEIWDNAFHPPARPQGSPTNAAAGEPPILKPVPASPPPAPAPPRGAPTPVNRPAPHAAAPAARPSIAPEQGSAGGYTVTTSQLLFLLHNAAYPDARKWAAEQLASAGEASRFVVQELTGRALADDSADVKLACLRGLEQLRSADPAVAATAHLLQADIDPRVRDAARALQQRLRSPATFPAVAHR